jgi:septal ring-binding cell division protein DamX
MAKNPINKNSMKKLFDTVSPMGPDAAEKFVRELLKAGEERRRDAEKIIAEVAVAGRKSAEQFSDAVQREVGKQLTKAVKRIDQLEKQVETLTRSLEATRTVLVATAAKSVADTVAKRKAASTPTTTTATAAATPEPAAPARKATAKKSPAKKAAAKKAPVKKAAAKKAPITKAAPKKPAAQSATTDATSA